MTNHQKIPLNILNILLNNPLVRPFVWPRLLIPVEEDPRGCAERAHKDGGEKQEQQDSQSNAHRKEEVVVLHLLDPKMFYKDRAVNVYSIMFFPLNLIL